MTADPKAIADGLALAVTGMTRTESERLGCCISCKLVPDRATWGVADHAEFRISRLCPVCFDEWASDDEEPEA